MGEQGEQREQGRAAADRAEARAALRKAAGLERLLGRLRAGDDDREAAPAPRPSVAPMPVPTPTEDHAAHAA
jgi:hypothetical protein